MSFSAGAGEEDEQARGVGAVLADDLARRDHVALALGHLLAVAAVDDALGDQLLRRLVDRRTGPAPSSPWSRSGSRAGASRRARARRRRRRPAASGRPSRATNGSRASCGDEVARVVPGGVDEGVHRLRLAARGPAALRAGGVHPGRHLRQRRLALAGQHFLDVDVRQRTGSCESGTGMPLPLADRTSRSRRWGSACPSSAGARSPSRAGGS